MSHRNSEVYLYRDLNDIIPVSQETSDNSNPAHKKEHIKGYMETQQYILKDIYNL